TRHTDRAYDLIGSLQGIANTNLRVFDIRHSQHPRRWTNYRLLALPSPEKPDQQRRRERRQITGYPQSGSSWGLRGSLTLGRNDRRGGGGLGLCIQPLPLHTKGVGAARTPRFRLRRTQLGGRFRPLL